jgi:hypothetical protein
MDSFKNLIELEPKFEENVTSWTTLALLLALGAVASVISVVFRRK